MSVEIKNSTSNQSNLSTLGQWLPYQITFSTMAFLPNTLMLVVFFHNRHLLRQSALIFGFVISNIIVVVACVCAITYQLLQYARNEPSNLKSIIDSCLCMFAPQLLWLAFTTKAWFLMAFGVDRLTAVVTPVWYHHHWTTRNSWRAVGLIYICAFLSVGITWIASVINRKQTSDSSVSCRAQTFSSNSAFIYGLFLRILGGTVCASTTLTSLIVGRNRMKKMNASSEASERLKKQIALIKTMLTLASFDVALVVIPNTLLFLDFTMSIGFPSFVNAAGPLACCVDTAVSAMTLLIFNLNIRQSTIKFFKFGGHAVSHQNTTRAWAASFRSRNVETQH